MLIQDWGYATAVYYSVISLSTIGFGDYVAGALSDIYLREMSYNVIKCVRKE